MLLGLNPKDFDIATEARPQQIKRLFSRNCRIIGRRFKLAHLHFNGNQKILEVATFRSSPNDETTAERRGEEDEESNEVVVGMQADELTAEALTSEVLPAEEGADGNNEEGLGEASSEAANSEATAEGDDSPAKEDGFAAAEAAEETAEDSNSEDRDSEDRDSEDSDTDQAAPAEEEDLLIVHDNEFGTMEEDALRRDFTVNQLFFDPLKDEIIDYAGGMEDIRRRLIKTIGDPQVRFREDPVRILRAAKFAGRLGLQLDPPSREAMVAAAPDLVRSAPPRVLEEILRLLRGGYSLPSYLMLRDVGALQAILPIIQDYLQDADSAERAVFWRLLDCLDNAVRRKGPPSSALLLACLFVRPVLALAAKQPDRSLTTLAEEILGPISLQLRLPRRDAGGLKRICGVQARFISKGRRRFRMASFLQDPYFTEAMHLFQLQVQASGEYQEELDTWKGLRAEAIAKDSAKEKEVDQARDTGESRAKNTRGSRQSNSRQSNARQEGGPANKKTAKKKTSQSRKNTGKDAAVRKRRESQVQTIEPEAMDLSAFDVELDPKRVPTFSSIVEGGQHKKRQSKPGPRADDDGFKPPPPPGSEQDQPASPPPPPAAEDDVFGDW